MTEAAMASTPGAPRADSVVEPGPTPGPVSRLRETPAYLWCLLVGLVCNLINGNSEYLRLPLSPDRLFIPLALVLLALDGRRRRLRWQTVHTLSVALVVWTGASMLWYGNLFDVVSVFALADRMVFPLLLFATAPLFFDTPQRRDLLLKTLTLIGVYLGVTGILELVASSLVFPRYIADPDVGLMHGRARGPFLGGDAMGVASAVCGFAGLLLFARTQSWFWRAAGLLALLTGLITTMLSLTRAAWLGAAVGLLAGALLIPRLRRRIPALIGALAAAAAAAWVTIPALQESFSERLNDQHSVADRLGSNDAALALLKDLPLTGIGWRRFFPQGSDWFRISDDYPMNNVVIEVHNVVLSRAAELGLPAAAVFLAIWALGPGRVFVSRQSGDLVGWRALGVAAFVTWVVTGMLGPMALPFPNYLCWLVVGVATYPWAVSDPTPEGLGETTASLAFPGPVYDGAPRSSA